MHLINQCLNYWGTEIYLINCKFRKFVKDFTIFKIEKFPLNSFYI